MPVMPWMPRVTYDGGSEVFDFTMPQRWWGYRTHRRGGSKVFSSGVPESFTTRIDYMSRVTLRFDECELLQVQAWILDAQDGKSFVFRFDGQDPTTEFTCYLDEPTFDDGFEPVRSQDYPNVFELDAVIRTIVEVPMFVSTDGSCGNTGLAAAAFTLTGQDAAALPFGAGRYILSLAPVAATWPPSSITDPSGLGDFTPGGFPAAGLYVSTDPIVEWISRKLSAGFIVPSYAVIGGQTTGTPSIDWELQDAILILHHLRGGVSIASQVSDVATFGWLGGSDYPGVSVAGIGPLATEDDDQLLLQAFTRYSPVPGGDSSGRLSLTWGSVPGPLTTTKLYGSANVVELP